LDAITTYLDMGTYSEWDEEKKLEFLTRELKGKRPLVPQCIKVIMKYLLRKLQERAMLCYESC